MPDQLSMSHPTQNHHRILAIAPSSKGFGFAVLEGPETLVDWGVKTVKGDKNAESLAKVEKLIAHYRPDVLVLPDVQAKDSRRAPRIRLLCKRIITLATNRKVKVALFSREQVLRAFFEDGEGTKHTLAEILAQRFTEQLALCLPPKRQAWASEDVRMNIFDAAALALVFRLNKTKAYQAALT